MNEQAVGSSTRQTMLDIARRLMMAKGYNATKVDEVCKLANVTKGAFFHYFKTKEVLGESVLHDYWMRRYTQFAAADWLSAPTPLGQLKAFLAGVADVFMGDPDGCSCLAGSFTQELATTHPAFRELVAGLFRDWADQIKPVLEAARAQSSQPERIDVGLLADHIIVVVEGAIILALARQDRRVIAQHLDLLSAYLDNMFAA